MKIEFTDEHRKRLAGLLPFAPGASAPFTPDALQSVEEALRPIFAVPPFKEKDRAYMRGHVSSGTFDKTVMVTAMWNSGLRWKNLPSLPDGEEVPCDEEHKDALADLPDLVFDQLWEFMNLITSGPTKEEKRALT